MGSGTINGGQNSNVSSFVVGNNLHLLTVNSVQNSVHSEEQITR